MDDKDFDYDLFEIEHGIDLRPIEQKETQSEPHTPVNKSKAKSGSTGKIELYDWLQCIVSAILCGILIFVFVGRVIGVEGVSMLNTLHDNDKVIMSDLLYTPHYGDVVVIKTEYFGETPLVKRVIAIEGETIDIDFSTGEVSINGNIIYEPYIREMTTAQLDFEGPMLIPEGFMFVMGDNRNKSSDSRKEYVGLIDTREILGKVLFVLVPGKDDDGNRSWDRIGSVYKQKEAA